MADSDTITELRVRILRLLQTLSKHPGPLTAREKAMLDVLDASVDCITAGETIEGLALVRLFRNELRN